MRLLVSPCVVFKYDLFVSYLDDLGYFEKDAEKINLLLEILIKIILIIQF